eukprot:CAMPEP_0119120900 /NCGR_PEP_ID=MMETSP1310-20130426/1753_1 /TAXON_ID=464262 /ORGANISM="Genus nov. species nov., Strain RCC2339" /LENGTH=161 /DNA_ID=CAMNT_0007110415 /DNA_START=114 /DNA_END=599 /DNA_ORIENTATION=+
MAMTVVVLLGVYCDVSGERQRSGEADSYKTAIEEERARARQRERDSGILHIADFSPNDIYEMISTSCRDSATRLFPEVEINLMCSFVNHMREDPIHLLDALLQLRAGLEDHHYVRDAVEWAVDDTVRLAYRRKDMDLHEMALAFITFLEESVDVIQPRDEL